MRLVTKAQRAIFLGVILVLAGCLTMAAVRVAYPAQLADSSEYWRVARAAQLDRANDTIQHWLGVVEQNGGDLGGAIQQYRSSLAWNPNKANYWFDLGQACQMEGDESCAESALQHAVDLAPSRPAYRWTLASYYVVTGRREKAFRSFADLLSMAPEEAPAVLDICLRAYRIPDRIWEAVVLPTRSAAVKVSMLTLMADRNLGNTSAYWAETRESRLEFSAAAPYVDSLIADGDYDLAMQVWKDLQGTGTIPKSDGSLVYNGKFDTKPLNAGFDWHLVRQPFTQLAVENHSTALGHPSLRIDFTVPSNAELELAYQLVPVRPSSGYVLKALVKSKDITSESGPRLRVVDAAGSSSLDATSTAIIGTTEWRETQVSFTTGPTTKAIRISIYRSPGRRFPMDISGTFWITSVTLGPISAGLV